ANNLPLNSSMETYSAGCNGCIKQERLECGKAGHPDKSAGQVTSATQAYQMLAAIDWKFLYDLLRRIAASEPQGRDISKKLFQLRIAGGPGNQSTDDDRLCQQYDQVFAVSSENRNLALQKYRKRK